MDVQGCGFGVSLLEFAGQVENEGMERKHGWLI